MRLWDFNPNVPNPASDDLVGGSREFEGMRMSPEKNAYHIDRTIPVASTSDFYLYDLAGTNHWLSQWLEWLQRPCIVGSLKIQEMRPSNLLRRGEQSNTP